MRIRYILCTVRKGENILDKYRESESKREKGRERN